MAKVDGPRILRAAFAWVVIIGVVYACTACTDASSAARAARGEDHTVRLWSGGKAVGKWLTEGHPEVKGGYEHPTSLIQFMDKRTGKLVILRGTISIERADETSATEGVQ